LFHFLLISPTRFKGVLATYYYSPHIFSHRVFGGESQELEEHHQEHTRTCVLKVIQGHFEDNTRDFQETALSKGEC
jgi:hypothetical protein